MPSVYPFNEIPELRDYTPYSLSQFAVDLRIEYQRAATAARTAQL